ncbi:MAG: DUF1844 domain-containing protein [Candidatus Schekmanbacteria bacterium]|nr:MAG: DUF1844 domain-containing protein [Candidatus Schekmanbacteria bacterium]
MEKKMNDKKNEKGPSFVFRDKRSFLKADDELKKDEEKKSKVSEEERRRFESATAEGNIPEVNFSMHVITLYQQACFYLGIKMPHPDAPEPQVNLQVADINIKTLNMLKEKTANNLTKEEEDLLNEAIYDLKMKYVAKAKELSSS